MYSAKYNLISAGNNLSFIENDKIHKENMLLKVSKKDEFISFPNSPTSGWKLSIEMAIMPNKHYHEEHYIITHPSNDKISIIIQDFQYFIPYLTIVKGIIQEQIILLNDSYKASIAIEGTKEYDKALNTLSSLENNSIKPKDLLPGDIISFDNSKIKALSDIVYLGTAFVAQSINLSYRKLLAFSSPKKFHIISYKRANPYDKSKIERVIKTISSFKNLSLLGSIPNFKFNIEDLNKDELPSIDLFSNLENKRMFDSSFSYPNRYIVKKSKHDPIFSNGDKMISYIKENPSNDILFKDIIDIETDYENMTAGEIFSVAITNN